MGREVLRALACLVTAVLLSPVFIVISVAAAIRRARESGRGFQGGDHD